MGLFDIFQKKTTPNTNTPFASNDVQIAVAEQKDSGSTVPFIIKTSVDPVLFDLAVEVIFDTQQASVSMLERKLQISYSTGARIISDMEQAGIVGPAIGIIPREILIGKDFYCSKREFAQTPIHPSVQGNTTQYDLNFIDSLSGHDFEQFCAFLLTNNGFEYAKVTPGSGDQGVDIIAEKDDIKYAIQCKCYSQDLGNTPIQEVHAGKAFYHCHVGVVMTNRYFTKGAQILAEHTGTLLWDRDKLLEMMRFKAFQDNSQR